MGVFPIPPRHPGRNLRKAHVQDLSARGTVGWLHQNLPNDAPVAIMLVELDADILPIHQLAKSLPGSIAEWLALPGRIDPCDANSMLHLVGVEDGDRVAAGNLDGGTFENANCRAGR